MVFSSTAMLLLNLFVFVPFGIYEGNTGEFEVGFLQMLGNHWEVIIVIWLVLLVPLLLPVASAMRYGVLIFAVACFTWLQSTLLMWDYGVFDGRGLEFQPFDWFGVLDLFILVVFVIGALIFAARIFPLVNTIACVFIVGQLGLVLSSAWGREDIWERPLVSLEIPEALSVLSSRQNIFHIILDSAQSDVFLELVDEADLRKTFGGFSLFLENAAVAPHTAFGLPSTFSGQLFDGTRSQESFFGDAIKNGFHSKLLQAGYTVNLMPLLSMKKGPYSNYFEIPSGYQGNHRDQVQANAVKLMDSTLFRISPHFLRIGIYDEGNWFLSSLDRTESDVRSFRERSFFRDYIDALDIAQDEPAYHFVHLMPPHPPYVTLADGSYAGEVLPSTRENFANEMRPMVALLARLVERLKSLGIYDESAIIVHGDHGSNVDPLIDGETVKPCLPRLPALLAVKRPQSGGPLAVSGAMTSLLDIAPTVLQIAGGDGATVFDIDPAASRRRHYFKYNDNRITRFRIDGSVFDSNSCTMAGATEIEVQSKSYKMGDTIEFGIQGNAAGVARDGWGPQLKGHSWSKAGRAILRVAVGEQHLHTGLDMALEFRTYIQEEKQPRQRIRVSVNDVAVANWVEERANIQTRRIHIPAEAVDNSVLDIVFEFPDAVSPKSLGLGADRKKLGIAIVSLKFTASGRSK